MIDRVPVATYRLQFNSAFTFADAAELVPYLAELGISHCYASPYLRARAGSLHGYDIVDHNALNPEIGDRAELERFVATLRDHDMGHILDLVPNHMGVGGDDNAWWLDVLENGQASRFAGYFDIDWAPVKEELRGKLLVPILGDHYGNVLESGQLQLGFEPVRAEFSVYYYEHRFPLDPATYSEILEFDFDRLRAEVSDPNQLAELETLLNGLARLPGHDETDDERRVERERDKEVHKRHLAQLVATSPEIAGFVTANLDTFNGRAGEPASFNRLHRLLERQPYRLAYWQVASDEINYRRFFDINDLAGLRMEQPEVFEETHRLVLELIGERKLDGLRIDHPDGLFDPHSYYRRLNSSVAASLEERAGETPPVYLLVEKILAIYEYLPAEWPVDGTTGYDFANLVHGLFLDGAAEPMMEQVYQRFIGHGVDYDDLLYGRKRLTIRTQLSSELTVLANLLDAIAQTNRYTRDYTLNGCREAITELVACFPVYRTYITGLGVSEEDRRYVDWAVAQAKKRSPASDISIFDFLRKLLIEDVEHPFEGWRNNAIRFAMRLQQYCSPVMAKALEDTTFYVYNRLVSLNEVGGDPRRFGTSTAAFHRANQERLRQWPHAMVATSTHDAKRSEDVRARIAVLSEVTDRWHHRLARWSRLNRAKKTYVGEEPAPSRNDEYLLYQTLVGTWPLGEPDDAELAAYRERIRNYMLKAIREAKVATSWINPNADYEQAVLQFVDALLTPGNNNPFLSDFAGFEKEVTRLGLLNALAQVLIKNTVPGVPDTYQGNELWTFDLVDPDNRRPVDYAERRRRLESLKQRAAGERPALARSLMEQLESGDAKLWVTWQSLALRREHPALFRDGDYQPLSAEGRLSGHVCGFARQDGSGNRAIVIAPLLIATLLEGAADRDPVGEVWGGTRIALPAGRYRDRLSGHEYRLESADESGMVPVRLAQLLADFPLALLVSE